MINMILTATIPAVATTHMRTVTTIETTHVPLLQTIAITIAIDPTPFLYNTEKLATLDEARQATIFERCQSDVCNLIVEYPGSFVTSRMITQCKRGLSAISCATMMASLGSLPETDANHPGTYKQLKISGKPTHCVVKAKLDKISATLMENLKMTREMCTNCIKSHCIFRKHISTDLTIRHDGLASYTQLEKYGYKHEVVFHNKEFVTDEGVHTNTIE
uniref:ISXO2-like transposase domain-containing protein n=1 Tax=Romanomermis culicivorax TaxID=13658 RepID=A0A915JNC2_ROMCU